MSKHQFTSRTKARKRAADVVFEADQRGMGRDPRVLSDLLRERKVITAALTPLPDYSVRIIEGVAANLRRIDDLITAHAKVPGLDRIPAVDLAVLRVAVWEMLENTEDVPPLVAIDEAVSIVKSISTDASPGFVNAVLDAVRRDLDSPAWRRERVLREEDTDTAAVAAPEEGAADDGVVSDGLLPDGDSHGAGAVTVPEEDVVEVTGTPDTPGAGPEETSGPVVEAGSAAGAAQDTAPVDPDSPATDDADFAAPGDGSVTVAPADTEESETTTDGGAGETGATGTDREGLRTLRDGHPTLDDLTSADLEELDELLDEY